MRKKLAEFPVSGIKIKEYNAKTKEKLGLEAKKVGMLHAYTVMEKRKIFKSRRYDKVELSSWMSQKWILSA